jgi:hypothetical protein
MSIGRDTGRLIIANKRKFAFPLSFKALFLSSSQAGLLKGGTKFISHQIFTSAYQSCQLSRA